MSDLVKFVQQAHGGLENWKKVRGLTVVLTLGGYLVEIKGHPDGLRSAQVLVVMLSQPNKAANVIEEAVAGGSKL